MVKVHIIIYQNLYFFLHTDRQSDLYSSIRRPTHDLHDRAESVRPAQRHCTRAWTSKGYDPDPDLDPTYELASEIE